MMMNSVTADDVESAIRELWSQDQDGMNFDELDDGRILMDGYFEPRVLADEINRQIAKRLSTGFQTHVKG